MPERKLGKMGKRNKPETIIEKMRNSIGDALENIIPAKNYGNHLLGHYQTRSMKHAKNQ